MRFIILFLVFQTLASSAVAETINKDGLVGQWHTLYPISKDEHTSLVIDDSLHGTFSRKTPMKLNQTISFDNSDIEVVGGIFLIDLSNQNISIKYKLVVSGWITEENKQIFGVLYMYRDGALFNGLPIVLTPD